MAADRLTASALRGDRSWTKYKQTGKT